MKIEIEISDELIPDGCEAVCWHAYRGKAVSVHDVFQVQGTMTFRRRETWRPATIADVDKGLRCRVKDTEARPWATLKDANLFGWADIDRPWLVREGASEGGAFWKFCEVADVPAESTKIGTDGWHF